MTTTTDTNPPDEKPYVESELFNADMRIIADNDKTPEKIPAEVLKRMHTFQAIQESQPVTHQDLGCVIHMMMRTFDAFGNAIPAFILSELSGSDSTRKPINPGLTAESFKKIMRESMEETVCGLGEITGGHTFSLVEAFTNEIGTSNLVALYTAGRLPDRLRPDLAKALGVPIGELKP